MLPHLRAALFPNSSRLYLEEFLREAAAEAAHSGAHSGARVLDLGAGDGRYKALFAGARYEATDFGKLDKLYGDLDVVADLVALPIAPAAYDLLVCTQVMEHLPDPAAALRQMHAALRPGGTLWLTAPLYFEEHEQPYDFYRYTRFGLRHLFEQAGLRIERLEPLEGYYGALAHQLRFAAAQLPLRPADYGGGAPGAAVAALALPLRAAFALLAALFYRLDRRHKFTGGHSKNYAVVARKPL